MSFQNNIRLISGRSNPELAIQIAQKLDVQLVDCCLKNFNNSEIKVQILNNVRNCYVYIIQTGISYNNLSVNDHLMELLLIIDACKRSSVKSINVILPCFPYARSDKKDVPRVSIGSKIVAKLLETYGVKRIISMDLHSGQIQGFTDIPIDNLYAINLHIDNMIKILFKNMSNHEINNNYILISPDNGGAKRVDAYAKILKMPFLIMHKQRDYSKESVVLKSMLVGDTNTLKNIKGKTAIIIDDIVDTMGTMMSAANELIDNGIKDVVIIATHGIFSSPAFKRIKSCKAIKKIIVTNTVPQKSNKKICDKLEVIDTSTLFATVIKRLVLGGSISELFN